MIDLRSDTVTRPTAAMRSAIAKAAVGDDVYGDDPTVNDLERRTAEILGLEAAVYMPTGTMTNQLAIRAQTEPGDGVLVGPGAHVWYGERGAPAAISGVMVEPLPGERGVFTADALRAALPVKGAYAPAPPRLVCVENTNNAAGGAVWPLETQRQVIEAAHAARLRVHLDGARLWNAAAATGIEPAELAAGFDSVSVCFSKGLGAPMGSALAGSKALIERVRRLKQLYGGGFRQAGMMAAGALHALEHHRDRIGDDHRRARRLAEGLAEMLPEAYIRNVGRDEHGHISLGKVDLGKMIAQTVAESYEARTGRKKKIRGVQLGYESRC
ncbi:MAG: threonine aldolase family protein, partial [Gemmatimonadota bacterium]|nr:threonine aldolase family protein [Gemmatimonadota bacterium]